MTRPADKDSESFFGGKVLSREELEELWQMGIRSRHNLLRQAKSTRAAANLAKRGHISTERMVEIWRLAQLRRVPGVGNKSAPLLLNAGIKSVEDLSHSNPDRLWSSLKPMNTQCEHSVPWPSRRHVVDWIRNAKKLIRIIRSEEDRAYQGKSFCRDPLTENLDYMVRGYERTSGQGLRR